MRNQFFIIGVQRCFTTWLATTLSNSPEIQMAKALPPANEPKYFLKPDISQQEYETLFYENNTKFYGEKTVSYLESSLAVDNILSIYPECKMIVCVRNPIHRTLSHFFYNKSHNTEPRSLEEVFLHNIPNPKTNIISMDPFAYITRSRYSDYIPKFIKQHPSTCIAIAESLPTTGIHKVCEFIGTNVPCIDCKPINSLQWQKEIVSPEVMQAIAKQLNNEKEILENVLNREISEWF